VHQQAEGGMSSCHVAVTQARLSQSAGGAIDELAAQGSGSARMDWQRVVRHVQQVVTGHRHMLLSSQFTSSV